MERFRDRGNERHAPLKVGACNRAGRWCRRPAVKTRGQLYQNPFKFKLFLAPRCYLASLSHLTRGSGPGLIERIQIVETADVGVADVNLRHGAAAGLLHHQRALVRVEVDADFFNRGHALGFQQALGAHAIRADGGGVHRYVGSHHQSFAIFISHYYLLTKGMPAPFQAATPPSRLTTSAKPALASRPAAVAARAPLWHTTMTLLALNLSSSPMRPASSPSGIFLASGKCPPANSAPSRTSRIRALPRLINWVICCGLARLPRWVRDGHSRAPPEISAMATKKILSMKNFTGFQWFNLIRAL